jgi:hypothetical protein
MFSLLPLVYEMSEFYLRLSEREKQFLVFPMSMREIQKMRKIKCVGGFATELEERTGEIESIQGWNGRYFL